MKPEHHQPTESEIEGYLSWFDLVAILPFVLIALALTLILLSTGCTALIIDRQASGAVTVRSYGAPFLSREGTIVVTDEWLGADNILHQRTIRHDTTENAGQQVEMMRLFIQALAQGSVIAAP